MKKLIIIGGGNMGLAIASGITKKGVILKKNIFFIEKNPERINYLKKKKYFTADNLNKKGIETIILAVKPSDFNESMTVLKKSIRKSALVISILAGVKIKNIEQYLGRKQPIARIMPNTPCQIGEGISALTFNRNVTKEKKEAVKKIFTAIGKTVEVNESSLDIITAVSGSGPAYFCYFIESIIGAGNKLGLNQKLSGELVLQTAKGTLLLLSKNNLPPDKLRKSVTSSKGTTEAALKTFQKKGLDKIIFSGIKAAKERSIELGKLNK
ncbi:MAG: pyrroline-5-carboxylate reductase [Candidatus Melainabacteria bacterium RIFCSPLOWO2_02_FULL_35_15]|nr:MAG: pyrroline-5-carboxylate reductase [Candidatus Melainabacteria bacterium RIFCSPLOWO2_12_FULL_35_11]OGI14002.1 MAG: pyrroline-5-carboxylate reductase [Candidatus Melainabacteria bacterium RIFCSPLOWO2_02_FULL_35_15]